MAAENRVIVVGAGAGGMMAAGRAAELGASVLLLEKTDSPGKKILISGKTRCNLTNTKDIDDFVAQFGDNGRFLYGTFNRFFRDDLLALLERNGVITKAERGGRIFPASDDARDVVRALEKYMAQYSVDIHTGVPVSDIVANSRRVIEAIDVSLAVQDMGYHLRRTKVGDNYVSEELKRGGDFGGEPSGAWIFPKVSLCPDGIYAAALIASIASQDRLSRLVDGTPGYDIIRTSIDGDIVWSELEARLLALKPLALDKLDGFKLDFSRGWVLVRPSGTEPKIRLTVEAAGEARLQELYEAVVTAIKSGGKKEMI